MFRSTPFVKSTHWLGLSGLYLFTLSGGISTAGFNTGLLLMLIALGLQLPTDKRLLLREPLLWSSLLFGFYLLYSAANAINQFPDTTDFQIKRAWRWFMISGFFSLICAWWIGTSARHLQLLLGLALTGFLLNFVLMTDWSHWQQYSEGTMRINVDRLNPNKIGWYAAVFCTGLIILVYRYAMAFSRTKPALHLLRLGASVLLCAFFGLFLLWSQSRAAWLAFCIALMLLVIIHLLRDMNRMGHSLKYTGLLLVTFVAALYLVMQSDIVHERIDAESETIRSLSTEQIDELPKDSIGIRLKIWEFGVEKFLQRPLLGWGLGTINMLASIHSGGVVNHLHNFYLETLVGLGLVGTTLLLLNIGILFRIGWKAFRGGALDGNMGSLLLGLLVLTAVFQFFSTHLGTQGKFLLIFLGGLSYSYRFRMDDDGSVPPATGPLA
jgi:O-antigen ligase